MKIIFCRDGLGRMKSQSFVVFIRNWFGLHSGYFGTSIKESGESSRDKRQQEKMEDEVVPEVKKARLETSPPLYGSLELIYHESTEKQHPRWERSLSFWRVLLREKSKVFAWAQRTLQMKTPSVVIAWVIVTFMTKRSSKCNPNDCFLSPENAFIQWIKDSYLSYCIFTIFRDDHCNDISISTMWCRRHYPQITAVLPDSIKRLK